MDNFFYTLGWAGSVLFAICAAPEAYLSFKNKHSNGLSYAFLMIWSFGEVFTLAYVVYTTPGNYPLIFNYLLNLGFLLVIVYYKFFPGKTS